MLRNTFSFFYSFFFNPPLVLIRMKLKTEEFVMTLDMVVLKPLLCVYIQALVCPSTSLPTHPTTPRGHLSNREESDSTLLSLILFSFSLASFFFFSFSFFRHHLYVFQENYLNFRPTGVRDDVARLDRIVLSADAISAGDLVTCRIRRYQRWELMPLGCMMGSVASATYVRGAREALVQVSL